MTRHSGSETWTRQHFSGAIDSVKIAIVSSIRESSPAKLRVLVALSVLLIMLLSCRSALAAPLAQPGDEPAIVNVRLDDIVNQLRPGSAAQRQVVQDAMSAIEKAHTANPDAVLVLRPRRAALRYDRLSDQQQQAWSAAHGSSAGAAYERAMADLLLSIVDRVNSRHPDVRLGVYGLPLEGRSSAIIQTNAHYESLLRQTHVLVPARNFVTARRDADPATIAQQDLQNAMAMRGARNLYFRVNSSWHRFGDHEGTATPEKHTAQDEILARALDTLQANPDLADMLGRRGIDPERLANSGDFDQLDLLALLADWDRHDSPWDLTGDGVVNIFDLLELLSRWANDDSPDDDEIARFVGMDNEYVIGSGVVIRVELLAGAPSGADVVFQAWSEVTDSIESPFHDTAAPFEYPSGALDHVTPGPAEVQALIRDSQDQVVLRLTAAVEFVNSSGDDGPPDDGGDDHPPSDDDDGPGDNPPPPSDDDDGDDGGPDDQWADLFADLDQELLVHLQDVALPQQPQLNDPQEFTIHSPGDIPFPIPSNSVLTIAGVIELSDANAAFIFNNGASDVLVRFEEGARIRYTGGFAERALFQFRSSASRIRVENAVIAGPTNTRNTCHGFATMLGNGTCSDITIVGGDVSGVRYTFQGEGGCERLLITGAHAHDNWEYFVWGSNNMVDATICHNVVDGVEVQHGIRLAPGVDRVNIVANDIRVGQQGLIKRSIWIAGAYNVAILGNRTRDGRITIGPNPAFNEPGPNNVVLAGNAIDHDRNNLAIELFSGARNVLVSKNNVTTPHSNWMQVGVTDQFNRPFENIHWTEDNVANQIERHGFDGVRVSDAYVGSPDIGPID